MDNIKRYRLSEDLYEMIKNTKGGLFLLYTRHNVGSQLRLLLNGEEVGVAEIVRNCDAYYRYCRLISDTPPHL